MAKKERGADERPNSQGGSSSRGAFVQPENPYDRVVQTVQDIGASSKVIKLLSEPEIPSMKDRAENPRGDTDIR